MAILPVGSALSNLDGSEALQNPGDLPRLQDGDVPHLRDLNGLRTDELPLQLWLAVLKKHGDDLFEVLSQLVDAGALRVRARPPWDISNEQTRVRIPLDDRSERPHEVQGSARSDG